MSPPAVVSIRSLTKRYRTGVTANDGIDLEIPATTVLCLLGPNGAGKTTLVRQLTGQLKPTSGSIQINGIDALRHPLQAKRIMGVVPQEAVPLRDLSVTEHLLCFGRLHGLSRAKVKQRTDDVLTDLGLGVHADKLAGELSGGLKRKLLIGIAVIAEPQVLVLDEPTTGLDPRSRREVWSLIRTLKSQGTTVLLTTHYMEEAEALSDRIAIVSTGRVVAEGSVEDLRARRQTNFKATYTDALGEEQVAFAGTQEELVSQLARSGIVEFSVRQPNLEDIFLELTESKEPVRV